MEFSVKNAAILVAGLVAVLVIAFICLNYFSSPNGALFQSGPQVQANPSSTPTASSTVSASAENAGAESQQLFFKVFKPVSALCGTIKRDTIPLNEWNGTPVNCSDKLSEKDLRVIVMNGSKTTADTEPAVEFKFAWNDPEIKRVAELNADVFMRCTIASIFTLTEHNEWNPTPDFYYHCSDWTKKDTVARVKIENLGGTAYVLVTPGTGDSVPEVDYAELNVSYYKN